MDISEVWPDWHVEELLGRGSFGKVYKISRTELGHVSYAAAKVIEIPQDESEAASLVAMGMDSLSIKAYFENTARSIIGEIAVMESLKGARNVVLIEDYKLLEHEDGIGWTICIRMELLCDLVKHQRREGLPNARETAKIGIDICKALECCHEKGVIHRDVKPENVFWSTFGEYKLGDFGIAKQIEQTSKSVYSRKGTGPYIAPEVMRGKRYGNNVDVYSLGIMLYRYLNNMRFPFLPPAPEPFTASDMDRALFRRLSGEALPAPSKADDALAKIVLKACQADPNKRYQSAQEFRSDLITWMGKRYAAVEYTREAINPGLFIAEDPRMRGQNEPHDEVVDETQVMRTWIQNSNDNFGGEEGGSPKDELTVAEGPSDIETQSRKASKFMRAIAAILVVTIIALSASPLVRVVIDAISAKHDDHRQSVGSEYVGEWYVPTDTDRHITIAENGNVSYGDDNHGMIASGKWVVIDEDAGAIKLTLKAQSNNEKMFEEGSGEFTRMAYAQSTSKMSAQLYYSPSEWETYVKK